MMDGSTDLAAAPLPSTLPTIASARPSSTIRKRRAFSQLLDLFAVMQCFVACVLLSITAAAAQEAIVTLPDGPVRGNLKQNTIELLGVPYAQPPIGDRRWRPPKKIQPWSEIKKRDRGGPVVHRRERLRHRPQLFALAAKGEGLDPNQRGLLVG